MESDALAMLILNKHRAGIKVLNSLIVFVFYYHVSAYKFEDHFPACFVINPHAHTRNVFYFQVTCRFSI